MARKIKWEGSEISVYVFKLFFFFSSSSSFFSPPGGERGDEGRERERERGTNQVLSKRERKEREFLKDICRVLEGKNSVGWNDGEIWGRKQQLHLLPASNSYIDFTSFLLQSWWNWDSSLAHSAFWNWDELRGLTCVSLSLPPSFMKKESHFARKEIGSRGCQVSSPLTYKSNEFMCE